MVNGNGTYLSKHIGSQHFIITPDKVASNTAFYLPKDGIYSTANSKQVPISFGFTYRDGEATTWEKLTAHTLDNYNFTRQGKTFTSIRTSGNFWAIEKYDNAPITTWEDKQEYFQGWKDVTERNNAIATSNRNREIGLVESMPQILDYSQHGMTVLPGRVKELKGEVPLTQVGVYLSKIHDAKQGYFDLKYDETRFLQNGILHDWTDKLAEEGIGPYRDVSHMGVRNFGAFAATRYLKDGSVALFDAKDIHQKAKSAMQAYGLEGEDAVLEFIKSIRLHELTHTGEKRTMSYAAHEARVGRLLSEFYQERASKQSGREKLILETISAWHARYASRWEKSNTLSARLRSKIQSLTSKYAQEARERGLDSEQSEKYVASKLEEALEGTDEGALEQSIESDYETLEDKAANDNYRSDADAESDTDSAEFSDLESMVDEAANDNPEPDSYDEAESAEADSEAA